MKRIKGLSRKTNTKTEKSSLDTDNSMVITRGEEQGGGKLSERVEGRMNGDGRRFDLGW